MRGRDGSLWLGTGGAGVCQLPNLAFAYVDQAQGLPGSSVFQIRRTGDELWVGTDGGLAALEGSSAKVIRQVHPEIMPWRVFADPADSTDWFATANRLVERGRAGRSFGPDQGLRPGPGALIRDQTGKLLVGTIGGGVLRFEYVRVFDDPVIAEHIVEYVVTIDG